MVAPGRYSGRYRGRNVKAFELLARVAPPPPPRPRSDWPPELAAIYAEERSPAVVLGPPHVQTEVAFRKWRIIHKFVHRHRFDPDPDLPRAEQWRQMLAFLDRTLGDPEVAAWVAEQVEIADHLARGISDLRPRKSEPCFELVLEHVSHRKRKAGAAHHFALAMREADPELDWAVTPEMIAQWQGR